jgi:serine/threonine protein kinase
MAEVWLARRQSDLPECAPLVVKTILPRHASDPEFLAMFLNETQLAKRLDHPNIVRVYEAGRADGCPYIAMEYVAGRTLRQILWRSVHFRKLFPVWFALDVAAMVCDALEYLHELIDSDGHPLKLLHRDVTPENLMVSFTGEVKLLDFGISRALSLPSLTQVGTLKGKYAYMAPELIDVDQTGADVDCRSDLYSLGVILYEALTGMRPYQCANDAQLLHAILDKDRVAEPPSHFADWIPETLDRLVLKGIAKNPADRFQSAHFMREALRDYMKAAGLCPNSRHLSAQVCGYLDSTSDSSPPPSMRLQSPHEVALKLDSGCHSLCGSSITAAQYSTASRLKNEPPGSRPPTFADSAPPQEKVHDWDAALLRVRKDDDSAKGEPAAVLPEETYSSGTYSIHADSKQEALELFEQSLELLRRHEIGGAIEALKRAAQLEPDNRLVSANLRRLEQLNGNGDLAGRRR